MIDPSLLRKEFVASLVEVIGLGIAQDRLEDAEAVLGSIRLLRPSMNELDTFEAWIAMKRGFWADAIRLLRNLDASASNWTLGKALMAFCQYATGDAEWSISANEVLHGTHSNAEAVGLVKLLLSPEEAMAAEQAVPSPGLQGPHGLHGANPIPT